METRIANMCRLVRRLILTCLFAALPAFAQYPGKPIHLIHPFPAGGGLDVIARAIARSMGNGLGQPVLVENRTGADGIIAAQAVIKATPDGYTLFIGATSSLNVAPLIHKPIPYDPITDFTPIGGIGGAGFFVMVYEGLPVWTLAQLIAHARANPGKLSFGWGSSTSHVAVVQLAKDSGLEVNMVPYRGDPPLGLDLVAGRLQVAVASGALFPFVKEGKLRMLATTLPHRSPLFPDVPTMVEAGAKELAVMPWTGLFGPANLPRAIVERLNAELNRALESAEVRILMQNLAYEPQPSTPEQLATTVKTQLAAFRTSGKAAGLITD